MFITKKALRRMKIMVGIFLGIGVFFLLIAGLFACLDIEYTQVLVLAVVECLLALLFFWASRHSEGKGQLINKGNKLVLYDLRPADFVRLYEEKRDCPDNVIAKPDFDVLHMLLLAYDALGDEARVLDTLEQMDAIAPIERKNYVKVLKSSTLFEQGKIEAAQVLYDEVLHGKMDFVTKTAMDSLTKCVRAIAIGEYDTAENYLTENLAVKSPKGTPLSVLVKKFHLAKIYCMTQQTDKAKIYLNYCIENGGETGIKAEAKNMYDQL